MTRQNPKNMVAIRALLEAASLTEGVQLHCLGQTKIKKVCVCGGGGCLQWFGDEKGARERGGSVVRHACNRLLSLGGVQSSRSKPLDPMEIISTT